MTEQLFNPSHDPHVQITPKPCSLPRVGTGAPESWPGGQSVNYGEMKDLCEGHQKPLPSETRKNADEYDCLSDMADKYKSMMEYCGQV